MKSNEYLSNSRVKKIDYVLSEKSAHKREWVKQPNFSFFSSIRWDFDPEEIILEKKFF